MNEISKLDPRLATIAGMVKAGGRLADVGCDHGLLITALLADEVIVGGVACDINQAPLEKARLRVCHMGFDEKIDCRLADGLCAVKSEEVDEIVIAGMGGELIFEILSSCEWAKDSGKHFVLQPMTKLATLRKSLLADGFYIESEKACFAQGKHYTVMSVKYSGEIVEKSELDPYIYIGELPQNPSPEAKILVSHSVIPLRKKSEEARASGEFEQAEALSQLSDDLESATSQW